MPHLITGTNPILLRKKKMQWVLELIWVQVQVSSRRVQEEYVVDLKNRGNCCVKNELDASGPEKPSEGVVRRRQEGFR
jgi:hypothetical protein